MSKKIKLLHVTSSLKIGGAEAVLCDIVRKLGNKEFEHHVIYFHEGPNREKLVSLGVKVYKINGLLCLYDPIFFIKLFLLIKKIKPDIIHSLLWSANVASRIVAKLLRIPHVSAYHLDIYNDGLFRNSIDKLTRKMSQCVIAVSDDVAKSLGNKSTYNKLKIIRNGIDFDEIHKDYTNKNYTNGAIGAKKCVTKKDLGFSDADFILGSVGRFHPQKNFPLLLRSFRLLCAKKSNTRLIIMGVGPLEQELKDLACQLGVQDKVMFVVGKKAVDYFPLFDCFVQSSIKEGLSIALLEAMSFGLACVVTNANDEPHPVIKHKKNGVIINELNENVLSDTLLEVVEHEQYAKKMGESARECVLEGFCVERMVEQYKSIFLSFSNSK